MNKTVELLGHTAKIASITGKPALEPWYKEDTLSVWLDFGNKPVGSTLGFGISIPAKEYKPDEFLKIVKKEGERRLQEMLIMDERSRTLHKIEEDTQKKLDVLASRILDSLS
jgi:hypothetical protein